MNVFKSVLLVALVLVFHDQYAQSRVLLTDKEDDFVLNAATQLYRDGSARLGSIDRVSKAADADFVKNDHYQEINYGFDQHEGWCRFTIQNTSRQTHWILKVQQARVDSVQLYLKRENGVLEKFPLTGHFQDIRQRPFYSLHFAFPILIGENETITFYLYTTREFGRHATILNIQKEDYFKNYEFQFGSMISFLCGMIILAALVGFVLFFFVFDPVYLYYSIYCFLFFILILADTGYLHAYISKPSYQTVINTFNTVFYYLIVGWHILFTIILLNLKKHYRRIYQYGYVSGMILCIAAFVLMIPLPYALRWWLIYFSYYIVLMFDVYVMIVLVIGVLKKEPAAYFYMAGFFVTVVVASLLMLADLQMIDGINQNTDLYLFIPLVEILFMVLGLGFRFSSTLKERFKVQVELNKTQNQIITIQEDERKRIAQDLHDDVGNSLAAIKHMLVQKRDNKIIENEIDRVIEDVRSISHNLMPIDFHEYSLANIVKHTVDKLHDHPTINFEYDTTGDVIKLNPFTELVIYRIVNELINNILKHSQASTAMIQLVYQNDGLIVMVEDNGVGLKKRNEFDNGLGLKSIELRAMYIRARLNLESDERGTLAILEIPYENI